MFYMFVHKDNYLEAENTKKRNQVLMYSLFEIKIKKFIKSMNQELMLLSLSGQ